MDMLSIINLAVSAAIGCIVTAMWSRLVKFADEQREVNRNNAHANRALQKQTLYSIYDKVKRGDELTPWEFDMAKDCYTAYHANGGNGTGTRMWEFVESTASITTGEV